MKTTIFAKGIIATMLAFFSFHAFASEKFSTKEYEQGRLSTVTVYENSRSGKRVKPLVKDEYQYDEAGKLVRKNRYQWDVLRKKWDNFSYLTYTYTGNETYMELFVWDSSKKKFQLHEKCSYEVEEEEQYFSFSSHKIR